MSDSVPPDSNSLYQATTPGISRQELLRLIETEASVKYPHLHVRFFPHRCMQARIRINSKRSCLMADPPAVLLRLLESMRFYPEHFEHYRKQQPAARDAQQFVLENKEIEKIGYRFVMKATIGPSFLSFWFRNESDSERIDLPVFYALEILNKLAQHIREAELNGRFDTWTVATPGDESSVAC